MPRETLGFPTQIIALHYDVSLYAPLCMEATVDIYIYIYICPSCGVEHSWPQTALCDRHGPFLASLNPTRPLPPTHPPDRPKPPTRWLEKQNADRNVTGAIGGSHIKIPPPAEAQEVAHTNYMNCYSIVLLGVVDKRGMFRWCCSGTPGSCGDSGIFRGTTLYGLLEEEQGKPAEGRRLLAADGACILGDAAFAEGPWMRTPIARPSTRAEEFFNFKHSAMRSGVENAFGRLKTRFASLRKGLDCELQDCALLVNACVVLHNFVSKEEEEEEEEVEPPGEVPVDDAPTRNGAGRRLGARMGSEHPARAGEVANLARAGFLRREWGAPGSRKDLARQGRD